jgi:hypothetical protein
MKEYFLAMFILMYVWSFYVRLRDMNEVQGRDNSNVTRTGRESNATGTERFAA